MSHPGAPKPPPTSLFQPAFLAPRYWGTWLGLGLLRLIHWLPYAAQLRIGAGLGALLGRLLGKRRRIAARNLELCFPELSPAERADLLNRHMRALGMGLPETAMSWWATNEHLIEMAEVRGVEHLQQAQLRGRGVILVTGHFTTMELAAHILFQHAEFDAMYRPMKNRLMDAMVERARRVRGNAVFSREDVRTMLRALKRGHAVWFGPDQDYGRRHSVFAKFFGVTAATITSTARFADLSGAAVVPFFPQRLPDGRYLIEVFPALEDFPSGDAMANAQRINDLIEAQVRKVPEQYLWLHRRFKTRPEGEPRLY
jgi:KDO2-lipid IV(A) lauroyltransferase